MTPPRKADRAEVADASRRQRWRDLTQLLTKLEAGGAKRLSSAEARQLTRLYRAVSSDLLEEVRRDPGSASSEYLHTLVGRAHGLLHQGTPPRVMEAVHRFFLAGFPLALRRRSRALLVATVAFVAGILLGAGALASDPGAGEVLLPFGHRYMDPVERVAEEEGTAASKRVASMPMQSPSFAAQLFTHNSRVTYLAFALAVTGGVGTVLLILANGAYLGAVGVSYLQAGQGEFLFAWILPHGVLELPAILIGASAGLVLARALFVPGMVGRRLALASAGRDALTLLLGATATLLPAGIIEATISQVHEPVLPYPVKIAFALCVAAAFAAYLLLFPRRGSPYAEDVR